MSTDKNPLAEKLNALLEFKRFWATRTVIMSGERLFDYDSDQLAHRGLLGPWKFNILETVYATAPTLVLIKFLNFLFGAPEGSNEGLKHLSEEEKAFNGIFLNVLEFLNTFTVPVLATVVAFVIGWGSLHRRDSNCQKRRRARHAYLYYDGAYGLLPEMFVVLVYSLLIWLVSRPSLLVNTPNVPVVLNTLLILNIVVIVYLILGQIPYRLFPANGYSARSNDGDAPWARYFLSVFLAGWPLVGGWMALLYFLSYSITYLLTEFKVLVSGN